MSNRTPFLPRFIMHPFLLLHSNFRNVSMREPESQHNTVSSQAGNTLVSHSFPSLAFGLVTMDIDIR